jgi:hypothetical protein
MNEEWSLREYILNLMHRWYVIAAFFLAGALLGWLASLLWPPLYRAHMDLYLGINAYRGPRDRYIVNVAQDELSSLDDYKNWQMEQVNILAFDDQFLADTLERLQAEDEYWDAKTTEDLYFNLHGSWRNAGRWHLTAEFGQQNASIQAVETWAQVIDERLSEAILHSRQVVILDTSMVAIVDQLTDLQVRQGALVQVEANLETARQELDAGSADEPWGPFSQWHLLSQATLASDWNPGWVDLLEAYPASDAFTNEYLVWVARAISLVEADLDVLPAQIASMETEYDALAEQYTEEVAQSRALSAAMDIDLPADISPQVELVRPSSTLMLVGGILAVLANLLFEIVRISRGEK